MRRKNQHSLQSQINVVPYLDVMLVLLVIFMVTAPLINQAVIELPTAGNIAQGQKANALEVLLPEEGGFTVKDFNFNGEETNFAAIDDVVDFIRERRLLFPDAPILIAANKDLPYQNVVDMLSALHEAGVNNFGLITATNK